MPKKNMDLGEVDGIAVAGVQAVIRNLGDGLSAAVKVDPQLFHHHETVFALVECEVIDLQFPAIKDANEVLRKHILKGGVLRLFRPATEQGRVLAPLLNEQRDRIQELRDAQSGAQALALDYDPLDVDENENGSEPVAKAPAMKKPAGASKPSKRTAKKAGARKPGRPRKSANAAGLTAVPDAD